MKMKRWIITLSFAFLLMFLSVFGTTEVMAGTSDNAWIIGGVTITDEVTSGEGWSYDAVTNTLTLDGYHGTFGEVQRYSVQPDKIGIMTWDDDLHIQLADGSENSITVIQSQPVEYRSFAYGIMCNNLSIIGNGSLTVTCEWGGGAISASSLSISEADVTANGGVHCGNGDIEISNGSLHASYYEWNTGGIDRNASAAISAGNMKILNSSVTATNTTADAIYLTSDLTMESGTLNVIAENTEEHTYPVTGIRVGGIFTINGGMVSVSGEQGIVGMDQWSESGNSSVVINGGTVDVTTSMNNGIEVSSVKITGGSTTIHAADNGIVASDSLVISGGTVDIWADEEPITAIDNCSIDTANARVTLNGVLQGAGNSGSTDLVDSNSVTGKSRFIALLYENVLERYATESEVADWVQELENGKNGAEVAQGFIFSQEFLNKNLSDEDYVECLYMSMMGRASDEGGKNDWVTRLDNGVSRLYVFKQFIGSVEFTNLCDTYGIDRGDVAVGEARDENYDVTRFVARNYREFLGRNYDEAGLNDWTSRINNREQTMQDIASGFVFSQECINMNLSNEAYVQMLYRGCFDRTGDEAGVADWVSKLDTGTYNREQVFLGFANSQEFANMVSSYGL